MCFALFAWFAWAAVLVGIVKAATSAGFTYRLYGLKRRASRSKGASENRGTHRVNGRYMII